MPRKRDAVGQYHSAGERYRFSAFDLGGGECKVDGAAAREYLVHSVVELSPVVAFDEDVVAELVTPRGCRIPRSLCAG